MRNTLLIARREYLAFVKTIGFWLSFITLPLIILASAFMPVIMSRPVEPQTVAVLDLSGEGLEGELTNILRMHGHEAPKAVDVQTNNPIRAQVLKSLGDNEAIILVQVPNDIQNAKDEAEREAKILAHLNQKKQAQFSSLLVARLDKGQLVFDIWSNSDKKDRLAHVIDDQLDALVFKRKAASFGLDAPTSDSLWHSSAKIEAKTPQSQAQSQKSDAEKQLRENAPRILGVMLSFATWFAIFSSSMILLSGVIEEKSSKVLEVLLASTSPSSLLIGKVLGVAMVLLTVIGLWGGVILTTLMTGLSLMPASQLAMIQGVLSGLFSPAQVGLMLLYVVCGYLMYGVIFAAIGSFCETQKDAQALMGPIMVVLMIPMFAIQSALMSAEAPIVKYLSYVPFFSPFLMPMRLTQGVGPVEIMATLVGMGALAYLMITMGSRAFRQGALGSGKLTLKGFFKAARTKT